MDVVKVSERAQGGVEEEFLSFRVGAEEYAIDILRVQEIRGYTAITPIPSAPPHIKGLINLRGTVVPVVGLRERFGMEPIAYDKFTVIVIVTVGTRVLGVVVDAVSDVLRVATNEVAPPPDLGPQCDTSFMRGMAKAGERLVVLLEIERVVGDVLSKEQIEKFSMNHSREEGVIS